MVQLHREEAALQATGAAVIVIGNGGPSFIEDFRATTAFDGAIYTDPSLAAYEAAQLERGIGTFLKVGAVTSTLGALRRGARQGRTRGDNLQQGGVVAVDRDGRVIYHHVSKFPGDNASPSRIAAALR